MLSKSYCPNRLTEREAEAVSILQVIRRILGISHDPVVFAGREALQHQVRMSTIAARRASALDRMHSAKVVSEISDDAGESFSDKMQSWLDEKEARSRVKHQQPH